jgi:RimJ/RimL family protein N-acetyltransferase
MGNGFGRHMQLAIRPLQLSDVDRILRYFYDASEADIERMGIDRSAFPPETVMRESLARVARTTAGQGDSAYVVWLADGEPLGFSSLKDIVPGEHAGMHLHMWESRGRGLGAQLFCFSALEFYRLYELPKIFCEPRAGNPMLNRMLQKVGFPLVRTYTGRSSALSQETELNRYFIDPTVAQKYLAGIGNMPAKSDRQTL